MESTLRHFLRFGRRTFDGQRRQFMLAGAGAFGSLFLGKFPTPAVNAPRLGIVGAGLAGLSCAHHLASKGLVVQVFEGRQRVGGRVTLVRAPDGSVAEGGGEFIGMGHHVWRAYAKHFGLKLQEVGDEADGAVTYLLDGRALSVQETEAVAQACRELCTRLNQAAAPINAQRPWESPDAAALDRVSMLDWLNAQSASSAVRRVFMSHLESNAVPLEAQSLLAQLAQVKGGGFDDYWEGSESFRCDTGNASLAQCLAKEVGSAALSLGTCVQSIERTPRGFVVKTDVGKAQDFDYVVLAVPPSVWSGIAMPAELLTGGLQMGHAVKNITWLRGKPVQAKRLIGAELTSEVWPALAHGDSSPFVNFSAGSRADQARARPPEERRRVFAQELGDSLAGGLEAPSVSTFVDWVGERFTQAGYSFPAPGQITRTGDLWEAGLKGLHFAGEHTCYPFIGYMEGALRSGLRAADKILLERQGR